MLPPMVALSDVPISVAVAGQTPGTALPRMALAMPPMTPMTARPDGGGRPGCEMEGTVGPINGCMTGSWFWYDPRSL